MAVSMRGASPPTSFGPAVEVTRITSHDPRHFHIISPSPWGAYFHWFGGRSRECFCQLAPDLHDFTHNPCERCRLTWPRKWRAYLHARENQNMVWRDVILEVTDNCVEQILVHAAGRNNLRGMLIKIQKTKGGKHGRFMVGVLPRDTSVNPDIVEIEPLPILKKLWDLNEARLSRMNQPNA